MWSTVMNENLNFLSSQFTNAYFFRRLHFIDLLSSSLRRRRLMPETIQKTKDTFVIMTVHEVAEYLRVSEAKVYRLAKERRLPVVRIGKTWRFRKDLLDDWLSKSMESSMRADLK